MGFTFILLSFILLNTSPAYSETSPNSINWLPESLGGLRESTREVHCGSAAKPEEVLFVVIKEPQDFACVGLYLEIFGGPNAKEYLPHILEIQGKRYGNEIPIGFNAADLFFGKKTPRLFPQLYVLYLRFSVSGRDKIQQLSSKYLELLSFRFGEVPEPIKQETLKKELSHEQFVQQEEISSEEGIKTYENQIFRILTEDTLIILSGINLSEKTWREVLADVKLKDSE